MKKHIKLFALKARRRDLVQQIENLLRDCKPTDIIIQQTLSELQDELQSLNFKIDELNNS
jgi:hypothetical protein